MVESNRQEGFRNSQDLAEMTRYFQEEIWLNQGLYFLFSLAQLLPGKVRNI